VRLSTHTARPYAPGPGWDAVEQAVLSLRRGQVAGGTRLRKAVMAGLKAARMEPAKALRRLELRRLDRLFTNFYRPRILRTPPPLIAA